jgi:hypothetical protein
MTDQQVFQCFLAAAIGAAAPIVLFTVAVLLFR